MRMIGTTITMVSGTALVTISELREILQIGSHFYYYQQEKENIVAEMIFSYLKRSTHLIRSEQTAKTYWSLDILVQLEHYLLNVLQYCRTLFAILFSPCKASSLYFGSRVSLYARCGVLN